MAHHPALPCGANPFEEIGREDLDVTSIGPVLGIGRQGMLCKLTDMFMYEMPCLGVFHLVPTILLGIEFHGLREKRSNSLIRHAWLRPNSVPLAYIDSFLYRTLTVHVPVSGRSKQGALSIPLGCACHGALNLGLLSRPKHVLMVTALSRHQ